MKKILFLLAFLLAACGATPYDPYSGLERAEREAEYFSSQLTATASSRMLGITETAAAWNFQGTQTAYPYTATALAWTPTPVPTATPNATATIVMANVIAQSTQLANETKLNDMKVERQRIANNFWAVILPIFLIGILMAAAYAAITYSRERRHQVLERGNGDAPLVIDRVTGEIVDQDANPNFTTGLHESLTRQMFIQWLERKYDFKPQYPRITAERQDVVKSRDQMIDLKSRTSVKTAAVLKLLEDHGLQKQLPAPTDQAAAELGSGFFPLPSWELLGTWEPKGASLPYGLTARGLGFVDMDQFPHLATIGKTGEGKSRRFFRPFIACALAAGHRVVIVGKSTDYWVFETHPNAALVKINQITDTHQAGRYAAILKLFVEEMNKRDDYLTAARKSTWTHAGRGRTFIVLDELGNALRLMPSALSDQSRIWVEGLVAEGRKVGFNVAVANQRATGMAGILSQTAKAIFRVERDEEKAHKSLSGASDLREGYFYMRAGEMNLTGSFEPSDEEIAEFLRSRPVQTIDADWMNGDLLSVSNTLPAEPAMGSLPPAESISSELKQMAESIREKWSPDLSATMTATKLLGFSQYGGSYRTKVDKIIEYLRATTTISAPFLAENGLNEA